MPKSTSKLSDRPIGGPSLAARAAGSYARFIPREEVGSFAAWTPGSLGATAAPAAGGGGEGFAAGALGGAVTPSGAAPAARPEPPDAAAQAAAARQGGYQDGYRDGLAALESFKQSFATQMSSRIGALLRAFDEQLLALEQEMARAIADTATQLARQVVRDEISRDPECINRIAQESLGALLLSARHISIRVHPDDEPLVANGLGDLLQSRQVRVVGDAAVARGGCLIDSDIGAVDARVQTRWQRALGALGADVPYDEAP